MKALTVQQPWAWAILHGEKTVENRTQAWTYRGPLAIHAGARWSDRGAESPLVREAVWDFFGTHAPVDQPDLWREGHGPGVVGAILGTVQLVDVHRADVCEQLGTGQLCSPWAERSYAEHGGKNRRDVVHLVLEDPQPLTRPLPCPGRLGLWTPSVEVLDELAMAVSA